jgi:aryl-alcohol dehydrogenase
VNISAAVTDSKGAAFAIQDLELGEPEPDEVIVAIGAAGICHTDLIVRDQWYPVPLPAVLGHEGAGTVQAIGTAVTGVKTGDRVALSFGSCGTCPTCRTGSPAYCHEFFPRNFGASRPDGSTALTRAGEPIHSHFFGQSSFATHAVVPERNLVVLPDDAPFEVVAPFGCGVQTGAGAVLNSLRPPAGSSIAIYGTGAVGLSGVMAASLSGSTTIIGIDIRAARLEIARELGATHTIDASCEDVVARVQAICGGVGSDFALETTGVPAVLRQGVDALAPLGVIGVIGAPPIGAEVSLDVNTILTAGRAVRGIVEGDSVPAVFIPSLIDHWRQGKFPADRLVSVYDFDQIDEAATAAERGEVIKPVLKLA